MSVALSRAIARRNVRGKPLYLSHPSSIPYLISRQYSSNGDSNSSQSAEKSSKKMSKLPPTSYPGILYAIPPNLCAFEPSRPTSTKDQAGSQPVNTIIWIGGQFDTLGSTTYPGILSQHLPSSWSLVQASLGSAGMGWGVSSVARDASDIAKIVSYIRTLRPAHGKIVLMGHSTGCQDSMEYVVGPIDHSSSSSRASGTGSSSQGGSKPPIDGIILQAPVSDREALAHALPAAQLDEANALARQMCDDNRGRDALPNHLTKAVFGRLAITAERWMNVASPAPEHAGLEDFFSSDLSEERMMRTFGRLPPSVPLLVLFSGAEEYVDESFDKVGVVRRWVEVVQKSGGVVDEAGSGLVEGANHSLNGQDLKIVMDLVKKVTRFVEGIEAGSFAKGRSGPNM